jgi:hypothetical protein
MAINNPNPLEKFEYNLSGKVEQIYQTFVFNNNKKSAPNANKYMTKELCGSGCLPITLYEIRDMEGNLVRCANSGHELSPQIGDNAMFKIRKNDYVAITMEDIILSETEGNSKTKNSPVGWEQIVSYVLK